MKKKRIYYPRTTVSQRKKLFEVWEETGNVGIACQKARVSERTFYNWKPRYEAGGYEALEEFKPSGTKGGSRIEKKVQDEVIRLKKENEDWGRRRIADEITKKNNWVPLVSASSVRRILKKAGLLPELEDKKKGRRSKSDSRGGGSDTEC